MSVHVHVDVGGRLHLLPAALAVWLIVLVVSAPARANTWSKPFPIGRTIHETSDPLATAANRRGDIVAALGEWPQPYATSIQVAVHPARGRLRPARTIFRSAGGVSPPHVAINGRGKALIVFTRYRAGCPRTQDPAGGHSDRPVSRRGLSRAKTISPAGVPAETPAVAMSASGGRGDRLSA